ncbi:MAG: 2-amino-4-hydroxy-6-hydroxymethyldihydropteridine diphosphokinase [Candidatus Omnitrophota bacterium]|nr:2-amino-4-hydroxy-6-hydroxymethyldihydropteridine diphosphokinase [Candidatus Omnitrophota bacterium]
MVKCYIAVGSNLGDRLKYITKAIEALKDNESIRVLRSSTIYETAPVSDIPQGKFLNGVIEVDTILGARPLLRVLNSIEEKLGRKRIAKNTPRTIDLDILYYGDENISEEGLTVPHPRIKEREFVLRGLRELGKA